MRKYDGIDFTDDIFLEVQKYGGNCMIKPNPCYDNIPIEAYESLLSRMSEDELIELLSPLLGNRIDAAALPVVYEKVMQYLNKRISSAKNNKQVYIYNKEGLLEFFETGRLTDHLDNLPPFNREEIRMVILNLLECGNSPNGDYTLYIMDKKLPRKDLIMNVTKDFGIHIEYIYPEQTDGLWKMILVQSKRLSEIFCDYFENHVPVNHAMENGEAESFLRSLIDQGDCAIP